MALLDDATLASVLDEVEAQIVPILKSEAARLAKAQESEPEGAPPGEETPGEDPAGSPPMEGSSPEGSGAPPESAPESAPPESAPPAGPPSPEMSSPGGMPTDPAQIAQMIAQAPPELQDAIYIAAKQAIFARGGAGSPPPASPSPAGPPAGPPGMSPAGPPMPPPAMKSEGNEISSSKPGVRAPDANGEPVLSAAHKSEIDELKKLVKSQGDAVELLTKAITKVFSTPVRKAVTSVAHLGKSEPLDDESPRLSAGAVAIKLRSLDRASLTKAERDNITRFYEGGQQNYSLVKGLLTAE